jgi:methyltransferase (TIGR00027 family)
LLGAGLDTFAYRSPLAARLRVFEVDHRRTQDWKRSALAAARIDIPGNVSFVGADLVIDSLPDALAAVGFDVGQPAVVSWLGVTMYLDRDAILRAFSFLASCAPGTELIADYMLPASLRDESGNMYVDLVSPVATERGEPWLSFLSPDEMTAILAGHGFSAARQVRQRDAVPAKLWRRTDSLQPSELSMIACARLGAD